jgi:hypothetical protein
MGILDGIKDTLQGHFDKKKEDREFEERLRLEASIQKRQIYEEEYKKNALEVAKAEAYREAANKTGLAKLRAKNRTRRLNENNIEPGTGFAKLREYTQKNKARTAENLKRTAEMRSVGKKLQLDRLNKRPGIIRKPFERSYVQ